MLLTHGNTAALSGNWHILELLSDRRIEYVLCRLAHGIPAIFRSHPVEIFVPLKTQDLEQYELHTINSLYVRSDDFKSLLRLKTITGCTGLQTWGDSNVARDVITVDDDFVQRLITESEAVFNQRGATVKKGSFVRLIAGETSGYCGHVTAIDKHRATVRIDGLTKLITVDTPRRNLICLDDVPKAKRTYYYSPVVAELEDYALLAPDLKFVEPPKQDEPVPFAKQKQIDAQIAPHERSATRHIRRLIAEGEREPFKIIEEIVRLIQTHKVKQVKTLLVLQHITHVEMGKALGPQTRVKEYRRRMLKLSGTSGIPYESPPKKEKQKRRPASQMDPCHRPLCGHERRSHRTYGGQNPFAARCELCQNCQWFRNHV